MTAHHVRVLIIDEDAGFLEEAAAELSGHFTVYTSANGGEGLKLFAQWRPQVVIVDAGVSDLSFSDLLENLKGLDGKALRIATSQDYSAIEKVVQAIDTVHIHKYFRKPVNYVDLIETINARTVGYQVGRGVPKSADTSPAYKKLHSIVDKAKEAEKLQRQLESQMAKIRDVEAESFDKMKHALEETNALRKKVADKEALIGSLQSQSRELEELKKRDVDRVERERETLQQELKGAKGECDRLSRENLEIAPLKSNHEKLRAETEKQRAEIGDLRVSVSREREAMVEAMARERETLLKELARKKDEAERIIEVQKERNRAELQAVQAAFEDEKQRAAREIERLKADMEKDRKARLAEIEAGRKRLAEELATIEIERKRVEEDLARKKDEAERVIELHKEQNKVELQALQVAFEEEKRRAQHAINQLKAEFDADRKAKLAEIEANRKRMEEDLARKMAEAEQVVAAQRERNKVELQALQSAFEEEKRRSEQEMSRLKAEFAADREAKLAEIEANRKRVAEELAEMEANRKRVDEDLARKRGEAERAIELQKERNKAELQALHSAFKEEQQRAAWYEIEQLKAELEKDRLAKLAHIEEDRKRGEQELAAIRAKMTEEKEQLEKSAREQREKAEAEINRFKEAAATERKKLTEALEVDLAAMKKAVEAEVEELRASATRELDRLKAAAQKKEHELSEALIQSKRMIQESNDQHKLAEGRIKALEAEMEKSINEKDQVLQELESVRADYDVVIRSREALRAEVLELRDNLQ